MEKIATDPMWEIDCESAAYHNTASEGSTGGGAKILVERQNGLFAPTFP
jgi:hypothetical protein